MSEPNEEVQNEEVESESTEEERHVSVQEMQEGRTFQVEGNDTSGYIGVDTEYRNYADETHRPYNTLGELQKLADAGIPTDDELVARQVPGTAAGLVEVEDDSEVDEEDDSEVDEEEDSDEADYHDKPYTEWTSEQLREELSNRDLSTGGSDDHLIVRLEDDDRSKQNSSQSTEVDPGFGDRVL